MPEWVPADGNRTMRSYAYTRFGEVARVDECVDGQAFTTEYGYDDVHGPHAAGMTLATQYHYTRGGLLYAVSDLGGGSLLWAASTANAMGQVTKEQTSNGVETLTTRNPARGWIGQIVTTAVADNNTLIQRWGNDYDEAGNLRGRRRMQPTNMGDSVESFGYDKLDRLKTSRVEVSSEAYDVTETFDYDGMGNITRKGGKTYHYAGCATGGGLHTVCRVGDGPAFSYDANGNMTQGQGRQVMYTSSNKVQRIDGEAPSAGGPAPRVEFVYDAEGNRVVQSVATTEGGETARTLYVGMGGTGKSVYERTIRGGTVEHVMFLYAGAAHGGNAFALKVWTTEADTVTRTTRFQHFDHLGSVTAMTNEVGRVVGASGGADTTVLGFDPWGLRRSPDGRPATVAYRLQSGHREFTGHETIPEVGLVNMNGRVYDPVLGRFLSPDPNVQFVADLQSYNRYSYASNNPLRYTDPTGYFLGSGFDTFVNVIGTAAMLVASVYCPPAAFAISVGLAAYNAASAINAGAEWGQTVGIGILGLMAGYAAGAAAGQLGASLSARMVGGAISGAVVAGITTGAAGGEGLGRNMLIGAFSGAAMAALTYGIAQGRALSQAEAMRQQGGEYEAPVPTNSKATATRGKTSGATREVNLRLNLKYEYIDGKEVPSSIAQDLTRSAEDEWTGQWGKYKTRANFHDPKAKQVLVLVLDDVGVSTQGGDTIVLHTAGRWKPDGTAHYFDAKDLAKTFAHEVGHALGATEMYNGRSGIPFSGHEWDLMGVLGRDSHPLESTIREILQYNRVTP